MEKMILRCALFITVGLMSACAAVSPRQAAFNEAEFARNRGSGTSTVTGQAFLKTMGGEVRYGAGNEVVMVPVNAYTTETHTRATIGGQQLAPHDPRYTQYRRTTIADGNGNFEFRNVPNGDYYLSCPIFWQVPAGYVMVQTGGVAYGRVSVGKGQAAKVILTR